MKKVFTLLLVLINGCFYAQNIDFTDSNFKNYLLMTSPTGFLMAKNLSGEFIAIDANNDGQIQVAEAQQISYLNILCGYNISNLSGIEHFVNLKFLIHNCATGLIQSVDISQNTLLEEFIFNGNPITSIDVSANNLIKILELENTNITTLEVSNLTQLTSLRIGNTNLTEINLQNNPLLYHFGSTGAPIVELDFSNNPTLYILYAGSPELTFLNIKNGAFNQSTDTILANLTGLNYLCCDDFELQTFQIYSTLFPNILLGTYCSFNPGGVTYEIKGTNRIDTNSNGCDTGDGIYPRMKFSIYSPFFSGFYYSNSTGLYANKVPTGNYSISPIIENPTYFNVSPSSISPQFPGSNNPFEQDFCLTPNGIKSDLEIFVAVLSQPSPGFDVVYKIMYKNKGNQLECGTINFTYQDELMDLVSSSVTPSSNTFGQLTWNVEGLQPFETGEIELVMNYNSPTETPPLNSLDQLNHNCVITSCAFTDVTPEDNTNPLWVLVRNAYDPNDITCLQGDVVAPSYIGKYVYYMIRFENLGNAPARNIVIENNLDSTKFIVDSLIPLNSNYDFTVRNKNNKYEFIFENINLPFEDEINDGYLIYKVKLRNNLTVETTFTNQANIFFDYNFPIQTNVASTIIQTLSVTEPIGNTDVRIYPNPTNDVVNIMNHNLEELKIEVFNAVGQQIPISFQNNQLDFSAFDNGMYLLKVYNTQKNQTTHFKIIKK